MPYNVSAKKLPAGSVRQLVEEGAILLDVRTQCEFAGYHIKGSINVPYDKIEHLLDMIKHHERPVITFSAHGRRSEIAAQHLRANGIVAYDAGTLHEIEKALYGGSEYERLDEFF